MTRLRPILMTSVATVFGHFPLTLVTGAGAKARNSIGLVLVAGMIIGTAFTLFFVPSIYLLIAKDRKGGQDGQGARRRRSRRRRAGARRSGPSEAQAEVRYPFLAKSSMNDARASIQAGSAAL